MKTSIELIKISCFFIIVYNFFAQETTKQNITEQNISSKIQYEYEDEVMIFFTFSQKRVAGHFNIYFSITRKLCIIRRQE